jgi:hypothetical protein
MSEFELESNGYSDDIVKIEALLADDTDDPIKVTLPSGKGVMWIKALNRHEVLTGRKMVQMEKITVAEMEASWIASALIKPSMTRSQVTEWQKRRGSVVDIQKLTEAIARISGLRDETPKSDNEDVSSSAGNGNGDGNSRTSE